jgi:glycogen debranching enzyme
MSLNKLVFRQGRSGDPPHPLRGCQVQAWSQGELIRTEAGLHPSFAVIAAA